MRADQYQAVGYIHEPLEIGDTVAASAPWELETCGNLALTGTVTKKYPRFVTVTFTTRTGKFDMAYFNVGDFHLYEEMHKSA